ncbi:MAG: saccharopine dehydrogenase NADP-binding domain-containing protein [Bacteroidota bacterium]
MASLLIYGAYGYSGRLIAEEARSKGLRPILAGRNPQKLSLMAQELDLSYQVLDLEETERLEELLGEVEVVLHCAGPFAYTAEKMIQACLATQTHYLDITGEVEVFEMAATYDEQAKEAGIMVLPGVGFDVVPTDCMALYLKKKMPEAERLELAFHGSGELSHGTANTAIDNLGKGGMIREAGKLKKVPLAHATKSIMFEEKELSTMSIPWGDVSTAWHSTQIPNITVYVAQPTRTIRMMKASRYLTPILSSNPIRQYLKKQVAKMPAGPSPQTRSRARSVVVGEVRGPDGEIRKARVKVEDGYTFTAKASINVVRRVLMDQFKPGFQTPALAFGESLVCKISETRFVDFV